MSTDSLIEAVAPDRRSAARAGLKRLSPREIDVLRRIASAKSSKETAEELGISPRTVEVYRRNIMQKLGAKNIADLVRIVVSL